eukprot:TRINITY_DN67760_c4_g1_i1.p3 TRINITY_DN67760_c4_g1~~TRINITY_DN67760_c4_g1_i1.p3  ORF type:complete len:401 (+),score=192.95 TRINITY_DN67760_c4_g1_i1:36-1238(+)
MTSWIAALGLTLLLAATPSLGTEDKAEGPSPLPITFWRRGFVSKFMLAGNFYYSQCNCVGVNVTSTKFRNSQCRLATEYEIMPVGKKPGHEKKDIIEFVGRPEDFRMVDSHQMSFSCIDGRSPLDDVSLRTPGGDFGEFVYAMAEHQKIVGKLYQPQVDMLMASFLQFRKAESFYYHTDVEAVKKIEQALIDMGKMTKGQILDLVNPPLRLREDILKLLAKPEHHGCLHIRLMLTHPDLYGIDANLVHMILKAYFSIMWNRDQIGVGAFGEQQVSSPFELWKALKFVLSEGRHREKAWVNVFNSKKCTAEGVSTLFPPHAHKYYAGNEKHAQLPEKQFFVFHPQAVLQMRQDMARFVATKAVPAKFGALYKNILGSIAKAVKLTKDFLTEKIPEYTLVIA